ncbi:MAG: hypothetical protein R3348_08340 [Xanthomonadales bacterium]|nr:hypothetical protein [Xanthomonadales bacterium]
MSTFDTWFAVLWKLALPVGVLSFAMVWWLLNKGILTETGGIKALRKEIDGMSKRRKELGREAPKVSPVHSKWLKFGGGFYGTVALYTYGLIEFQEIRDTIAGFGGIPPFLEALDVRLIIRMFIEAVMNFVSAITWPVYWMKEFGSRQMWIWFLIAYGAYWLGMRLAQARYAGAANPAEAPSSPGPE